MRITVDTVARMAGVSRGTVDRVLHNRPNVRPEVRERILEVMKELDYKPNAAASALAFSRKIRKVGVILPHWKGFFKEEIYRGIDDARRELNTYGVEVLIAECPSDEPDIFVKKFSEFVTEGINGLCLCAQDNPLIREKISELKIPVITFNSDIEDSKRVCFVGQDLVRSGRIAAEIMVKCVHDGKILVVVGNMKFSAHRQRLRGFFDRMAEHGRFKESFITAESFNEYSRTLHIVEENLRDNAPILGIYMESVAACAEAVKNFSQKPKPIIICHDLPRSTKALLKSGEVDFALEQDIYRKMMTGRKDSEETRTKKSVAGKNALSITLNSAKNHSQAMKNFYAEHPEALVAKAEQGKGRKQSLETIAKRSASRKKYFAKKRQEREEAMRRFKSMMIIFLLVIQNDTPTYRGNFCSK